VTLFLQHLLALLYSPCILSRMPSVKELGRNKDLQILLKALHLDPA